MSVQNILEKGEVIKFDFTRKCSEIDRMELLISLGEKFFTIKIEASTEDEEWLVNMVGRQFAVETENIPLTQKESEMIADFAVKRREHELQKSVKEIRERWLS